MKKIVAIIIIQFTVLSLFAQSDTTKVEQYCQVIATPRLLSNKVTIDIDFGEEKSYWVDTRLRAFDGKLRKFNTVIDALNFMGSEGWIFINAYPVTSSSTTIYHYGFKKLFPKTQVL